MTAAKGYVWFLPSWFPLDWYDTDKKNVENNATENVPCTTEEMVEAINGHISLSYKYYADNASIMQENITVKEWREKYKEFLNDVSILVIHPCNSIACGIYVLLFDICAFLRLFEEDWLQIRNELIFQMVHI